jgi:hypothetical protein
VVSISDWKRWILYNLIGEGVHNVLFEDQIRKLSGRHFEENLIIALNNLVDNGLLLKLETNKKRKFIVNYEKLIDAQKILNDNRNWKLSKISRIEDEKGPYISNNINQFYAEPEGYSFWFNLEDSPRKRRSVYNIYHRKTDDLEFAAQILTQKYSKILYLGSLRQNRSIISRLWKACLALSDENVRGNGEFILQDLQDKERKACGNNRQRGKIALVIFKKLEYLEEHGKKGNSTTFRITGRHPPFSTLDDLIQIETQ